MFGKHIKAVCLTLTVCLIAIMFFTVTIVNGGFAQANESVGEFLLLIFVVAAIVPVFIAHERHN